MISNYYGRAYDVALADFNKDGRLDAVASSFTGNQMAWFENPGNNNLWTQHTLATGIGETRTARVADFNGDTNIDILATSRTGNTIYWYQNNGNSTFTAHTIDTTFTYATHGEPVDMNGDGKMDFVMAGGFSGPKDESPEVGQIAWYSNNGNGTFTKHTVGALPYAFDAVAGDLDGDGRVDIAAAAFARPGTDHDSVVWYKNNADGTWTKNVLKQNWYGADGVILSDVDGDGRLDIFASAESTTNEVRWWRNEMVQIPEPSTAVLLVIALIGVGAFAWRKRNKMRIYD